MAAGASKRPGAPRAKCKVLLFSPSIGRRIWCTGVTWMSSPLEAADLKRPGITTGKIYQDPQPVWSIGRTTMRTRMAACRARTRAAIRRARTRASGLGSPSEGKSSKRRALASIKRHPASNDAGYEKWRKPLENFFENAKNGFVMKILLFLCSQRWIPP